MTKYYVYEHWIDGDCFCVGKGSGRRKDNFYARKRPYKEFMEKRGNRIEDIAVVVIKYFKEEEEAYEFEAEWSRKRRGEGYPVVGMIGKESGFKGKSPSEETRAKMSAHKKGRPQSTDHIKKRADAVRGKYVGENSALYGFKHTEKTKERMREARKKNPRIGKDNPMYGRRGKDNPNSKIVYVVKDEKIIAKCDSGYEADEFTGVSQTRAYARGVSNHHHRKSGFNFYYEDFLPSKFKDEVSYD